jgi:ABC-2 type transport system ATP-binding protein
VSGGPREHAIETERLTKSYGRARGIVDVDLAVEPGEIFGFLGPNGAGKTTMIRVLLDLIRPTSGRARVLGLDSHADAVALHRRVGYVAGNPVFYDRLTGRELLTWLGRLRGVHDTRHVDALAERLGLDLVLSYPVPRARLVWEKGASLVVGPGVMAAVTAATLLGV